MTRRNLESRYLRVPVSWVDAGSDESDLDPLGILLFAPCCRPVNTGRKLYPRAVDEELDEELLAVVSGTAGLVWMGPQNRPVDSSAAKHRRQVFEL